MQHLKCCNLPSQAIPDSWHPTEGHCTNQPLSHFGWCSGFLCCSRRMVKGRYVCWILWYEEVCSTRLCFPEQSKSSEDLVQKTSLSLRLSASFPVTCFLNTWVVAAPLTPELCFPSKTLPAGFKWDLCLPLSSNPPVDEFSTPAWTHSAFWIDRTV